jgi:hypothetical protein
VQHLWSQEMSASAIAKEVGLTRNAVCGLVYRLRNQGWDFARREATTEAALLAANGSNKATRIMRIRSRKIAQTRYRGIEIMKERRKQPEWTPGPGVSFLDRTPFQCAAIIDDEPSNQRCCGLPNVPECSYCEHHKAIYYKPAPRPNPNREKAAAAFRKFLRPKFQVLGNTRVLEAVE